MRIYNWPRGIEDLSRAKCIFYTTCPKCAKAYGKNYVVGVVAVS